LTAQINKFQYKLAFAVQPVSTTTNYSA